SHARCSASNRPGTPRAFWIRSRRKLPGARDCVPRPGDGTGPLRAAHQPAGLGGSLPRRGGPARQRRGRGAGRIGAHRADVRERIPRLEQARDPYDVAGLRRVNEGAVADVHALMLRDAGRVRMEEDEVAGLEVVPGDPSAFVVLETGVVPELDPELTVDVHRQARAVEPGRRRAAPN